MEDYTSRPPTPADLNGIVELMNACESALGDAPSMTVSELRRDWIGLDLNEGAIVAETAEGEIVGYADIFNRNFVQTNVYIFVRPGPGQDELFARLVAWGWPFSATPLASSGGGASAPCVSLSMPKVPPARPVSTSERAFWWRSAIPAM